MTPARLECSQKVQTTKMLTHRVFQLKLVGRHVVQRRKETFGIIHILEGVWVGCPGVDMLTHVPISSRCSTYTLLQYCLPRSGWWINPVRGWRLPQSHLQSLQRQLRIDASRKAPADACAMERGTCWGPCHFYYSYHSNFKYT